MDALDLLEQQHRDVSGLIDRIAAEPGVGRRITLVVQVVRAVEAHSRAEERAFYGAFGGRIGGADGRLYEGFEQHALLRFAAANLLRTRPGDVRFGARVETVRQIFSRHAAVEEDWMFPRAKRSFHDEDLDRIGVDIERAHARWLELAAPAPARPRAARPRATEDRQRRATRVGSAHREGRREGAAHR